MKHGKILLGLIGFPLSHSWSADFYNEKFRLDGDTHKEYRLFPLISIDEFPGLLAKYPELCGLNVTIPYKEKIIPFLDDLDDTARSIGAVNTVTIDRTNGMIHTKGFNTDAPGFLQTIRNLAITGPALILGTGGAAKAVAFILKNINIPFHFVSRKTKGENMISYDDLTSEIILDHPFIINATPAGMYPDTAGAPPIPYQVLTTDHLLYDLIYNPEVTEFMKRGMARKARVMNGKQMLLNQAELSRQILLGKV